MYQPAERARAEQAQATLDELVAGIPWAHPMGPAAFDTRRLRDLRRTVADPIVGLAASPGPTRWAGAQEAGPVALSPPTRAQVSCVAASAHMLPLLARS